MDDFCARLMRRFRRQQDFAAASSPLSARLLGLVADWLAAGDEDPLAAWLVRAAAGRASFDVPLLLMAGVHRAVLAGDAEAAELGRYFPTVDGHRGWSDDMLAVVFRQTVCALRSQLTTFLCSATVQTNEMSRGLCWLLPVHYFGWQGMHLVDLGASAGLNLVADYRSYRLVAADTGVDLCRLGHGGDPFLIRCEGRFIPPHRISTPILLSRSGCDLAPIFLRTPQDEYSLSAFVWGDQPDRLAMLRCGINALHQAAQSSAPVQLYGADLPDMLPRFLEEYIAPLGEAPVVIFNTYLATYLYDKGISLRAHLDAWARRRREPVLWLQWEPLRGQQEPPEFGWVGWTADLWQGGRHWHGHLAWAHPHGTRIQWLPDLERFANDHRYPIFARWRLSV
jgi:hypothetical protein